MSSKNASNLASQKTVVENYILAQNGKSYQNWETYIINKVCTVTNVQTF